MTNFAPGKPVTGGTAIYTASVTTKMMQDYRVEVPATDASRIALVWNESAALDVVSIGSDRSLYHLYRDTRSATGWSSHRLNLQSTSDVFVHSAPNHPDRLFAIGTPQGQTGCVAELVRRSDGTYSSESLGALLLFSQSLNVVPCDNRMIAVGRADTGSYFDRIVAGILPHDACFMVRLSGGGAAVLADKVVCLPLQNNTWPHLAMLTLNQGTLHSWRGMREAPLAESDLAALPALPGATRAIRLEVDEVKLPPLPAVVDFAAVVNGEGGVLMLAVDGSHSVHMLTGTIDTASPGLIRWTSEWSRLELTGKSSPSFRKVCMVQLPDGRTRVLLHETVGGNLWITGWGGPGLSSWDHAVNLGIGGMAFAASVSHREEMAFATASADKGIEAWTRTSAGNWMREGVHVSTGERIGTRKTRRTTLSLADQQNALPGEMPIRVKASQDMAVTINGESHAVGPDCPATVMTKAGCVHVTNTVTSSLHVPLLTFEADFLAGGRLEVRADSDVQEFFKSVTAENLLDAVDPLTGTEILRGPHRTQQEAESLSRSLRQIAGLLERSYASKPAGKNAALKLKPARGVRLAGANETWDGPLDRTSFKGSWQLSASSGRVRFKKLRAADGAAALAGARERAQAGDFLGIDWGSLFESAWHEITEFVAVVIHEGEVVLTFWLNGVEQVLTYVLEEVEQIFDLVLAVFDIAGAAVGNVVGWLMSQVGFLFDWDKIKQTRDRLRSEYSGAIAEIPLHFADPATLETDLRAKLEEARTQIQDWIATIRTQYIGMTPFNQVIGTLPTLPSLFETGGVSFFPQSTWLMEKAVHGLEDLVGAEIGPDIPGFAAAIESLSLRVAQAGTVILSLTDELSSGRLSNWMTDIATFRGDTIVALLDFLASKVNAVVDLIEGLLHDLFALAHLVWSHVGKVLNWFDREIYLPFVSAFYAQVVGSKLSVFDLLSLCIAIPFSILGPDSPSWPRDMDWVDFTMGCWIPINAIVEAVALVIPVVGMRARVISALLLFLIGAGIGKRGPEDWFPLAGTMIVASMLHVVALIFGAATQKYYYGAFALLMLCALTLLAVSSGIADSIGAAALVDLGALLSGVALLLPEAVRVEPPVVAGYTILQGLLAFGTTALYVNRDGGAARIANPASA